MAIHFQTFLSNYLEEAFKDKRPPSLLTITFLTQYDLGVLMKRGNLDRHTQDTVPRDIAGILSLALPSPTHRHTDTHTHTHTHTRTNLHSCGFTHHL